MASSTGDKNELEDFEAFLEPNFQPIEFANDLLLATNDSNDSELDLITPIKKLKFDVNECDKRMSSIASSNYESLVCNFSQIERSKLLISDKINPSMERVNSSFERIKKGIIKPYDNALSLNTTLKKIHVTLNLLRGTSFFTFLIQHLEELEQSVESSEDNNNSKDLVKLAKLHFQFSQLYNNEGIASTINDNGSNNITKTSSLLSIKLIRDYRSIQVTKRLNLKNQCSNAIVNEFSHSSSFNISNIALQNNLIALFILDENDFYQIVDKSTLSKQIQSSSTQLSRSLQSPRNFSVLLKEIKQTSAEFLDKLNKILLNCDISSIGTIITKNNENNKNKESKNLLDKLITNFDVETLSVLYWSRLSYKFKKNIVATMARGGPIAKNLKMYYEKMKISIDENFESKEKDLFFDAIDIINGIK